MKYNEFDDPYRPSRDFIERLSSEGKLLEQLRGTDNRELTAQLRRIADEYPETGFVIGEAVRRLVPESEIVNMEQAREN